MILLIRYLDMNRIRLTVFPYHIMKCDSDNLSLLARSSICISFFVYHISSNPSIFMKYDTYTSEGYTWKQFYFGELHSLHVHKTDSHTSFSSKFLDTFLDLLKTIMD